MTLVENSVSLDLNSDSGFPGTMHSHLSGALPVKQARSRVTRDRLLAAGGNLLQREVFEQVSIADIARAAGCSVGAFYFRFRDKESFFACIVDAAIQSVLEDLESFATDRSLAELSGPDTVARCVLHFVSFFRTHEGLIRAVHRKTSQDSAHWKPIRLTAKNMAAAYERVISVKYGELGNATFRRQTKIGFQIAAGVLVNAVLNRPALLALDSKELPFWLTETVIHCLHLEVPASFDLGSLARTVTPAPDAMPEPVGSYY